jgi:hypothetical protein
VSQREDLRVFLLAAHRQQSQQTERSSRRGRPVAAARSITMPQRSPSHERLATATAYNVGLRPYNGSSQQPEVCRQGSPAPSPPTIARALPRRFR